VLRSGIFRKLDERRVRYLLAAFFLALAIPAALLIAQAYDQLKWEAFRRNQLLAEDVSARIDVGLRTAVAAEEARSFGEYSFFVVEGDAAANFVQRSPLSAFPVASDVPGAIGYFQVDASGALTTPLLPAENVDAASFGISADEQVARRELFASIREVLAENRLVPRSLRDAEQPAEELPAPSPSASQLRLGPSAAERFAAPTDPAGPAAEPPTILQSAAERPASERPTAAISAAEQPGAQTQPSVGAGLAAAAPDAAPATAEGEQRDAQGRVADARSDEQPSADANAAQASQRVINELRERTPPELTASAAATDTGIRAEPADKDQQAAQQGAASPASASAQRQASGTRESIAGNAPFRERSATVEQTQAAFDRLAPAAVAPPGQLEKNVQELREIVVTGRRLGRDQETANAADDKKLDDAPAVAGDLRRKRSEQSLVPEPKADTKENDESGAAGAKLEFRVRTFESELDPFETGALDTGHIVMFRNVWRGGQRYIQGVLIDRERFVAEAVESGFRSSSLAGMSDVAVSYRGASLGTLRAAAGGEYSSTPAELAGTLLHRARMSPPFADLELSFSVNQLPRTAGGLLLIWIAVALGVVLCGGFALMYRFAVGQIRLARQQQDFVSAVSHELKTPLTSIRMYGEMLKAGWADDAKKQTYYEYIHSESERLSRLIENVLQLARLTRSTQQLDCKRVPVAELMDMVKSKVATQVERAGFELALRNDVPADAEVVVDADSFAQIFINLVDNALKFSTGAERKAVDIASRRESDGRLLFTVRDFGPGIPKGQLKKIFELFYRPENELTRETVGTGIGLALVRQLATAMRGRIEVRNCEPGAEFRISFPPA
jgi:signal transduction histidine kinase